MGCGKSSSGDSPAVEPAGRVNWESVPAEFHPTTESVDFQTSGVQKLKLNLFSFAEDVEIIYLPSIPVGSGTLKIYKVWKESGSFGTTQPRVNGVDLEIQSSGSYWCSIHKENKRIVDLKGGCYVRLQILLAPGAESEVYNVGKLISRRFIPVDNDTFLKSLNQAPFSKDKFAVIDDFLGSYNGTSKQPGLSSEQLGKVVHQFSFKDEKLQVLRKLHLIVIDRQNLGAVIESEFSYFEREEARRVVGI